MDHYQILQVNFKATQQEIKQSYRRLAKQFHPDSQQDSNCDKIIALNAAYEVLGNSNSRRLYDRQQRGKSSDFLVNRQARNAAAQRQYQQRKAHTTPEVNYQQWLQEVYFPINHLATEILYILMVTILFSNSSSLLRPPPSKLYTNWPFKNYFNFCIFCTVKKTAV